MLLTERPEFHRWLMMLEREQRALELGGLAPPEGRPDCVGCGAALDDFNACGRCLVCLAEQFGVEQGETTASVSCRVRAVLETAGDLERDVVRMVVEEVLDDYCGPSLVGTAILTLAATGD